MTTPRDPSLSVPFVSSLEITGHIACPPNPILFDTGHREDMGHGMEAHYHRCPECYHVWRHLRPVLPTGEGWTQRRAQERIASEKAANNGYSVYLDVMHVCPKCKNGTPIVSWARGPINPDLMHGNFFPMSCA